MEVLKFGGTSVATPENIKRVLQIIKQKKGKTVVVVSAFGGVTDQLLQAAVLAARKKQVYKEVFETVESRHLETIKELLPVGDQSSLLAYVKNELNKLEALLESVFTLGELSPRTTDLISGYGELLSAYCIAQVANRSGMKAVYKDARELIITDEQFGNAEVDFSTTISHCKTYFANTPGRVIIIPGFVAASINNETTTLGRGGSDYTAAILARALQAKKLEIWTDVSGIYTANPKLVKQANPIEEISYEEAMELSHFGAKVIYPPTIHPVMNLGIPVFIKNTFDPESPGTKISQDANGNKKPVRGISHIGGIALLTLEGTGMVGIPGFSKRFFDVLYQERINIVLITQASSEHSICIAIHEKDAQRAKLSVDTSFAFEIERGKLQPVILENGHAIIALVGDRMKSHQGLSGKMFSALGKNNVNIRAIAQGASERNISAVIAKSDVKKALNTLHERFFENRLKQINLFVIGVGNVGSKLLEQLYEQKNYLKNNLKLNVRVIALSNSRRMCFDENGIDLAHWEHTLEQGKTANVNDFIKKISHLNMRNSVFVDNTAHESIANLYAEFLKRNIAVVTCNKIASSSGFEHYASLKALSKKYNAPFLFETNVGAGLPIIDTLKNLIASGDKILEIQAVLSGSLNFIFNNFNDQHEFSDIVKQAQDEGYTEPDPRIDLSGVDVMRKILILARESGFRLEMSDIENKSFLPEACMKTKSVSDFYDSLVENKDHFNSLYQDANNNENRLKYVAQFGDGKAAVGLQHVAKSHPFYNLEGKDNIVLFYTSRYKEQPLLIKGAGAGADVTASGIFADIIRIGNF